MKNNSLILNRFYNSSPRSKLQGKSFTPLRMPFLALLKKGSNKAMAIDPSNHFILKTPHPSPFSVHKGFTGCKHFSQTNAFLQSKGREPMDWDVTQP
jgi:uracil DNA glycosylase